MKSLQKWPNKLLRWPTLAFGSSVFFLARCPSLWISMQNSHSHSTQHAVLGSWWVLWDNWGEETGMSLILGNVLFCWFAGSQFGCVTFWSANLRCSEVKQLPHKCSALGLLDNSSCAPDTCWPLCSFSPTQSENGVQPYRSVLSAFQ